MFSAETISDEFHLNITRDVLMVAQRQESCEETSQSLQVKRFDRCLGR